MSSYFHYSFFSPSFSHCSFQNFKICLIFFFFLLHISRLFIFHGSLFWPLFPWLDYTRVNFNCHFFHYFNFSSSFPMCYKISIKIPLSISHSLNVRLSDIKPSVFLSLLRSLISIPNLKFGFLFFFFCQILHVLNINPIYTCLKSLHYTQNCI